MKQVPAFSIFILAQCLICISLPASGNGKLGPALQTARQACRPGMMTKSVQPIEVTTNEKKVVAVEPGTPLHLIGITNGTGLTTFEIFVPRDHTGKSIGAIGKVVRENGKPIDGLACI